MSKSIATFDAKSFGMAALDDEDYGIEEGSALDQAQVRGNAEPRLGAKKDRFSVKLGKETIQQFKKGEAVEVVVHGFAPGITQRQYFEGKYVEGADFVPPVCWSQDGKRPDDNCTNIQAKSCKTCQRGSNGSKECSFTSKLVVSLATEEGDTPLLMDLNLNSGSLFSKEEDTGKGGLGVNWPHYVRYFKEELGKNMARFVTLISFNVDNEDEHENQMLFRPVRALKKGSLNWDLHDDQDPEDLLERVRISYADYEAETEDAGDQETDEDDDDDEEEAPAPKSRAKKKAAAKRKPAPVEEEEDDDEEEEDEEEEAPAPKARAKKKAASRRKAAPVVEDDEDEEEDEEEEAPAPRRSKKKAVARRRPAPVIEDDEEDEYEEEEEAPAPKARAKKKVAAKKKPAPVVEDDDDDEEIPLDDLDAALSEFEGDEDEWEEEEYDED